MKDDASIQGKLSCVMDVEAYLRRIGLEQAPRPDQEGLMSVQRAHRWAIPFENFDIPLGRGISLDRSEEHTSELQSLMRISYAVFCLKKKHYIQHKQTRNHKITYTT